jgi:hypothetical protein
VRLTHTKWNGIVSQSVSVRMTATFAAAKAPHATSTQCLRSVDSIADIPHRLDQTAAKLGPEPADANVHDVAARVERVPPHILQKPLASAHLAIPSHEVLEQEELAFAERYGTTSQIRHTAEDTHGFVVFKTDLEPDALPTAPVGSVDEEGEGVELIDEIEDIAVGDTPTLTVSLDAGSYVLICNIVEDEGDETIVHYQQGMRTGFTVE